MPKRKATDAPIVDENPTKRITRSSGALSVTQPIANAQSPTKRRGRPPGIPANAVHKAPPGRVYAKKGARARSLTTSSLKENERCDDEEDEGQGEEADELNISSENELPSGPARTGRRVVLDSVMMTASRRVKVATQHGATSKRSKTVALASQSRQESPERSDEPDSASIVDAAEAAPVASPSKTALGKRPQIVLPKTSSYSARLLSIVPEAGVSDCTPRSTICSRRRGRTEQPCTEATYRPSERDSRTRRG